MLLTPTTNLIDIRFHGRAGQGVVTASRLLGEASIMNGKWVHAFPNFGPERMGAPVSAFTRISDEKFMMKTEVYHPDIVVIIDPTLVQIEKYYEGLKPHGKIIANTASVPPVLQNFGKSHEVWVVDGDEISRKILGRTIANTVMLGALARITDLVEIKDLISVLYRKFSDSIAENNAKAIEKAYMEVKKI